MKTNYINIFLVLLLLFCLEVIYGQSDLIDSAELIELTDSDYPDRAMPKFSSKFATYMTYFFGILIGLALLFVGNNLRKEIQSEEDSEVETRMKMLSFGVGLSSVIALDVISDLSLSELITRSFLKLDINEFNTLISPIIISIISALIGVYLAKKVHMKVRNKILAKRYFIILSTIILFFLIRIYIIAWTENNRNALFANFAFLLGYSLILINNYGIDDEEVE